ncbi:MAG: glycoside hydrolase family 16 protein [Ilumatobacter sp.]|uniref:glycoside hydrolase family 16 protein n=1 Tax=Ilumatobacter sp. TaxID=1967498 RepID=UPI00260E4072|nr:glycoside hydrolase family 16 protein [Ilumatobacter sp.]MDJ0770515.1 glycoside hydrolase family 16 protein [Ilumatobacter sp.]
MIVRPRHRLPVRAAAAFVAAAVVVAACGSDDSDDPAAEAAEATTPSTAAPASTSAPETTAAPTTTIAPPEPIPPSPPDGMELVWSDEFDGPEIDLANWTYDIGGWGWGNGEAQYYTDRPENARIENGLLVIELRQEKFEESFYTSARLKTQGLQEFQYGRLEARIKVPPGKGTWPAFWMLGSGFEEGSEDPAKQWPTIGEIDIMEYVGRDPDLVLGTIHGPGYSGAGGRSTWFRQEHEIADEFRTFAIDWDENRIQWFYEGEMYAEIGPDDLAGLDWVFDQPFFFILNFALGGTLGGFISPELEYPMHYYVDYVRVYQDVAGTDG